MLNAIRMDLYKMFHMKSFWIILIIMFTMVYFTTTLSNDMLGDGVQEITDQADAQGGFKEGMEGFKDGLASNETEDNMSGGISIAASYMDMDNVEVDQMLYDGIISMLPALFMVIFTVIFIFSDMKNGYVKNIGGQVKRRSILIGSKAVAVFVSTVFYLIMYSVAQTISCSLIFGHTRWGNWKNFMIFMGVQCLLHYALLLICMTVTLVVRNSVFSMTFAVCLSLGIMNIVYVLMDRFINKYINADFQTYLHTVTGKIGTLPLACTTKEIGSAILVAVIFAVVMLIINIINIEKRDLV